MKYILLFLIPSLSFAATNGSIFLSGYIPKVVSVVVTPVVGYNNLDFTTTATNLVVANITEQSNVTTGYTVTCSSSNAGLFKNGLVDSIPYTAKYNGTSFSLSSTPVVISNNGSTNSVVNVTKPLTINYTGVSHADKMDGTYSDTLTFTIIAN